MREDVARRDGRAYRRASLAFAAAAGKEFGPLTDTPPADDAPLDADWRSAYPQHLAALADAWKDPAAWEGMTRAGGVELPAEVMGNVALAEVVIHGWDVARAIGAPYDERSGDIAGVSGTPRTVRPRGHRGHVRTRGADRR